MAREMGLKYQHRVGRVEDYDSLDHNLWACTRFCDRFVHSEIFQEDVSGMGREFVAHSSESVVDRFNSINTQKGVLVRPLIAHLKGPKESRLNPKKL
jgi:hypothetical protein